VGAAVRVLAKSVRALCILIAGLAAALGATAAGAEQLGLQLYSLRHQLAEDLPAALAQISAWGIEIVEGGGELYGYPVDEFRGHLERNGLRLVSVGTSYEELRDNPIAVVYKARYFGAGLAMVAWIPHDGSKGFTIEDARAAIAVLNEAGRVLGDNGITLQYHLHGYEFLPHGDGTLFDVMAEGITDAQFQMDVFWVRQAGVDPVTLLQKYPGRFVSLHLKDRAPGTADSGDGRADDETNIVLGQGDVGIAEVVAEARRQGIRYFFLEDESSRVLAQIPESIEYFETIAAQ
jgi:sugar phosphate isomerase/epimerase